MGVEQQVGAAGGGGMYPADQRPQGGAFTGAAAGQQRLGGLPGGLLPAGDAGGGTEVFQHRL